MSTTLPFSNGEQGLSIRTKINNLAAYVYSGFTVSTSSGTSGKDGKTYGTSGTSGSGTSGSSGFYGSSGKDGSSGRDGSSGSSGSSGWSGGSSGTSGKGTSGSSGSGISGTSGLSGANGAISDVWTFGDTTHGKFNTNALTPSSINQIDISNFCIYENDEINLLDKFVSDDYIQITSIDEPNKYHILFKIISKNHPSQDISSINVEYQGGTSDDLVTGNNYVISFSKGSTWSDPRYILVSLSNPNSNFHLLKTTIDYLTDNNSQNMVGNTTLLLTSDEEIITNTLVIDLPYNLSIQGTAYEQCTLIPGSGITNLPLFDIYSNCSFSKINLNASGTTFGINQYEDAIEIENDDLYIEFKDSEINGGFNKGIVSYSNSEFWIFESVINNCVVAGFELNTTTSGARYRSAFVDYSASSDYPNYVGINLLSGGTVYLSSESDTCEYTTTGQTFIKKPDDTSVTFDECIVVGNIWNANGNFYSGFDFTRTDGRDANIEMLSNIGIEDMNPHCKINVSGNTSSTQLPMSATWTKCNFNISSFYTKKYQIENNKITYLSSHMKDIILFISANSSLSGTGSSNVIFAWCRNGDTGTTYGNMTITFDTTNVFNWGSNVYIPNMSQGDYLELFFYGNSALSKILIIRDLNITVLTQ